MKKIKWNRWLLSWILLSVNVILLCLALFSDGPWLMISSLLWSVGILIYHRKISNTTITNGVDND